jgi:hypothetical protein
MAAPASFSRLLCLTPMRANFAIFPLLKFVDFAH